MLERNEGAAEIVVTKENLPQWRAGVAEMREQKGQDLEALRLARKVREGALRLNSHEDVVNLWWEDYLIGKHLLMYAKDEENNPFKKAFQATYGLHLMKNSSKAALEYANRNNVEKLKPRTHRFSGEIDMISKRYTSAINHFSEGIKLYEAMENPQERWNSLEFKGFLAEAMILSGQVDDGVNLAQETYRQYDEGDGLLMKDVSYYQWAVWKSGCVFKMWNALLEKKITVAEPQKSELTALLDEAGGLLRFPDGSEKQGSFDFGIRKTEYGRIKKQLGL